MTKDNRIADDLLARVSAIGEEQQALKAGMERIESRLVLMADQIQRTGESLARLGLAVEGIRRRSVDGEPK